MVRSSILLRALAGSLTGTLPLVVTVLVPLVLPLSSAHAGDTPRYEAAPAWVAVTKALPTVADEAGIVLFDRQFKLEGGELWSYTDTAFKITSPEMLTQLGTLTLAWQPEHGDVIIHRVEIVRDGTTIDALAGGDRFEVIRREAGLERMSIDGRLTATHQIRDLRVGDTLRLATSTTERDDVLDGKTDLIAGLITEPFKLGGGAVRVVWPKDDVVAWKVSGPAETPQPVLAGAYRTLTIDQPLAKLPDAPDALPNRYQPAALVEASSFADWSEVSALGAKLFAPKGLIADGSALAERTDAIAASSTDPAVRAAGALRLVQDEVRYLFNGLDGGNYRPQTPAKTWEVRYGDCKAKTLLLLAMLDRLGIAGEAAFVNTDQADAVVNRLPSFAVFDHVIVRADIAGQTAWLDGTRTGDRLADLTTAPPFRYALPGRPSGGTLIPIDFTAPVRPDVQVQLDVDSSVGTQLPAAYTLKLTLNGATADQMKAAQSSVTADQMRQLIDGAIGGFVPSANVAARDWSFDPETGALVVTANGLTTLDWSGEGGRRFHELSTLTADLSLDAQRFGKWADAPVLLAASEYQLWDERYRLPAGAFALEGTTTLDGVFGGVQVTRDLALSDATVTFRETIRPTVAELSADTLPSARAEVARAQAGDLRIVPQGEQPTLLQEVRAARKSGALARLETVYAAVIANAPDDEDLKREAYINRARFHAGTYDFSTAVADVDRAIAIKPESYLWVWRASLVAHDDPRRAAKDYESALALAPSDAQAYSGLVELHLKAHDIAAAHKAVARAEASGVPPERVAAFKADILARDGKAAEGLALLAAEVGRKGVTPSGLNAVCWYKAQNKLELPSALKDCTRGIELLDQPAGMLDSRALVFAQMGRWDDALGDLNAGLAQRPNSAESLYLRGVVRTRLGTPGAADDLEAARIMQPGIEDDYARYGMTP